MSDDEDHAIQDTLKLINDSDILVENNINENSSKRHTTTVPITSANQIFLENLLEDLTNNRK